MRLPARNTSSSPERRRRWFDAYNFMTAILILVIIAGILEIIPANAYMFMPGDALQVQPMIKIKGHAPYRAAGKLYMTDVTVYKVDHLLEELYAKVNPDVDLEPAQSVSGGLSQNQYLQLNTQLMSDSIQQAEAAALRVSPGYGLKYRVDGPQVVVILTNTDAAGKLKPGDVIKSVDGHRVAHAQQVSPLVQRLRPGQIVTLGVERAGTSTTVRVRTIASRNGVPDKSGKRALIGVQLQDKVSFVFPVHIAIDRGNIVGPSAGLMFTLGIIEQLERKDLTHGCPVAGTGTIDYLGNVGAIGGAKQKIIAASHAGAKYFLVPDVPDNVQPAEAHRGGVTVLPVKTLQQALQFLRRIKPCG